MRSVGNAIKLFLPWGYVRAPTGCSGNFFSVLLGIILFYVYFSYEARFFLLLNSLIYSYHPNFCSFSDRVLRHPWASNNSVYLLLPLMPSVSCGRMCCMMT